MRRAPVLVSVRPEFSGLDSDVNRTALIRYDYAALRQRRWVPAKRGVILRFEMPLAQTDIGASAETGLGDAQLLGAPYFTSKSSSAAAWVCRRQRAICVTIGRSFTPSARDSGCSPDTETRTDWQRDERASVKSGVRYRP